MKPIKNMTIAELVDDGCVGKADDAICVELLIRFNTLARSASYAAGRFSNWKLNGGTGRLSKLDKAISDLDDAIYKASNGVEEKAL